MSKVPLSPFGPGSPLSPNESSTISYTLIIDEEPSGDGTNVVSNITYSVNEIVDLQESSNTVAIFIVKQNMKILKQCSSNVAIKGQLLTFTNTISNLGNTANTNIVFTDSIPEGTTFVEGSVKINDVEQPDYNPADGFSLDNLSPQDKFIVTFEVTII